MFSLLEDHDLWALVFLAAGVWNVATGLFYLLMRRRFAARYGVGAGADPSDRILANLVHIYFGVVAFWIVVDPGRDAHLIGLWVACKLTSVVLAILRHCRAPVDERSMVTLVPATADVIWSALFLTYLAKLLQQGSP